MTRIPSTPPSAPRRVSISCLAVGTALLISACSSGGSGALKSSSPTGATSTPATATAAAVTVKVTASPGGNVRSGDGTNYPVLLSVLPGTTLQVLAVSARGNGWLQVRLPSGALGWVAPTIVTVSGDPARLPRAGASGPTAHTKSATSSGPKPNLSLVSVTVDHEPVCGASFIVSVLVRNTGAGPTRVPVVVSVFDTLAQDGAAQGGAITVLPVVPAGAEAVARVTLTVSSGADLDHVITARVDAAGVEAESDESDNTSGLTVAMGAGTCS